MIIIGSRFFTWGTDRAAEQSHCAKCGVVAQFTMKRGMRFITLFFIIPIIPISGIRHFVQCPSCGTRYQATAQGSAI